MISFSKTGTGQDKVEKSTIEGKNKFGIIKWIITFSKLIVLCYMLDNGMMNLTCISSDDDIPPCKLFILYAYIVLSLIHL